ncbi:4-hydroxy-3-methylbut-2-enyl diphosphate reductase [Campylobacter sp. VBCF_06 NA8]|uniref:4-hydroxy-3-methylbut-2-enyl diphosphate reductase n=1 Tax=unclassified Campylobacter TaxID=2593542 RepID=UPI0022E9F997|nr:MULTISPECIES: 4-hydroxy-3-methylbut-2-enyl diphosphate reductase [unclassified Campylobacter]MDA3043197.1 4-hydroxy-3-methylbut-2-enyl diphosphate reductase [Campylobacter sp. JMF_09 ED2]MDA3044765.1 4-hydroxy-3-methylbut-2-enyl diphosphate reductase [Campylobacter sp. JMF_07 ED4]MDA3045974.1 4-hydroxy-3-methylbut-2-enyl diphosphate reductase [Campylobacter sp. VBCF_06 NA8]MDA3047515.1 4-hydroxy-3-methylbut-2-enyl diphosphate reductase [Campylobacter sp. JMF_08 NE1]MDA3049552.1 4-hydroxy-3-
MRIEMAKSYGFCFGVKRAIKIAENAGEASTIGELIHNAEEINRLRQNFGVKTLKDASEVSDEKKLIIRTHGIQKEDLTRLREQNKELIDATCPFVTKPQQIVEKMSDEGYDIVIFGDSNHPEVKGVKSYAKGRVFVVLEPSELDEIKLNSKVAVVSQTTKKIENFVKIVDYLMQKSREVRIFNTICNATLENQEAAAELAKKADIMIIVGGKNSSNTKQLFLISQSFCKDSYLIENEDEIEQIWFKNKNLCGISAGASTPDWIIKKVVEKIEKISKF